MNEQIREYSEKGEPEKAALIRKAMEAGHPYVAPEPVGVVTLSQPKLNGSKEAWLGYAKEISDIDHEVLEAATRDDLIVMLRANGLIEMPDVDEDE